MVGGAAPYSYIPLIFLSWINRIFTKSEYELPDEVFMIVELAPGSLKKCAGMIKYHAAFNDV